mmetsp:Transcript_30348/g.63571  ORF Transcript_30348/g.63571 Transcript_30348/m.63571 type:complete len:620 (+) Transcript_30348:112-1971(+)
MILNNSCTIEVHPSYPYIPAFKRMSKHRSAVWIPKSKATMAYFFGLLALAATRASAFVVVAPTTRTTLNPASSLLPPVPPSTIPVYTAASYRHPQLSAMTSSLNEKVMEKLPSTKVVDAVIESRTESIVASDVATRAGVSLSQARKDLTTLASLSRGDISVSSDGELIYEFPKDLNLVLSSNSAKFKARQSFEKAWPSIFWGLRVSFGVALVASVALVFSAIVVLQTSSSDDDRRDDRRGGGGGMPSFFFGPSPFDFFYYRPYGYYGYYGQTMDGVVRDPEDMGFLESVFSFVFGDGNPNAGLEEKRLSLAAQMIRNNKGAVTAEQLAPYCDAPDVSESSGAFVDESFVLPIVSQLDGEPQVTEEGDIIYVFPDLQLSASASDVLPQASEKGMVLKRAGLPSNASTRDVQNLLRMNGISSRGARDKADLIQILEDALGPMTSEEEAEAAQLDPSLLQEREYKFSLASGTKKFFAGALGIANLGGVLYLGNLFRQYNLYSVKLPSFLGLAQTLYPGLVAYAILFCAIPVARNYWISQQNSEIQGRNEARRRWREVAQSGSKKVLRKLKAAAKFATNRTLLKGDDSLYNTKQSSDSLQAKKDQSDLDEFDRLLNDDQNTFQ